MTAAPSIVGQFQMRRAQPSESREIAAWIKAHHYTKRTPPGYVVALEFLDGRKRIGAMLLGRPGPRKLDADRVLELTRMYFVDEAPTNTESRALAMMRKFVRTWLPNVRLLLAYSDPAAGHTGGVYEADGWAPFGTTGHRKGYGWRSRPSRDEDPVRILEESVFVLQRVHRKILSEQRTDCAARLGRGRRSREGRED
jgi:hypothetical protein